MDVSREEYERLLRRIEELEARLAPEPPAPADGPLCGRCGQAMRAGDRFCIHCGAAAGPAPAPGPAPGTVRAPAAFTPVVRPPSPPSSPSRSPPRSLETVLGERFAPRVGAVLVFLAALFFLGLGIQRGVITPVVQLLIAAAFALALAGIAAWLTSSKGYGKYPQILEGTAACILYVTAFVAHALPYYQRETGLTETGSALLMAAVAAATVGLALARDARPIASLGYALGFLTAALGWGTLPALTLPYVAILGSSLAAVVAWKRWSAEGAVGTLATGGFLLAIALLDGHGAPSDLTVLLVGLVPAAAFLWLAMRPPADRREDARVLHPVAGLVTLGWLAYLGLIAYNEPFRLAGYVLVAMCALSLALAWGARRTGAVETVVPSFALAGLAFYLVAPFVLWSDDPWLATTFWYAVGSLAATAVAERRSVGLWTAGAALAIAAALVAVLSGDVDVRPDAAAPLLRSLEALLQLAAIGGAFVLLQAMAPARLDRSHRALALFAGAAFVALWGFALFSHPVLTTLVMLAVAGGLVYWGLQPGSPVARESRNAGLAILALAALKVGLLDPQAGADDVPLWVAALDAAAVAGLMLALFHAVPRAEQEEATLGTVLVGGSAAVIAGFLLAYGDGAWTTTTLALEGAAYLTAGFVLRKLSVHRYTGFALLGVVLLRVFLVDLSRTDLAVRAFVFLVLGAILLGVGFAYARLSRKVEPPATPPPP